MKKIQIVLVNKLKKQGFKLEDMDFEDGKKDDKNKADERERSRSRDKEKEE